MHYNFRSGWTRVRRLEDRGFADGGEGYVPSSFLKMLDNMEI